MAIAKSASDLPLTSNLADYDATGVPYHVQSDTFGAYSNGVSNMTSILVANGYNGIVWGDWRLESFASTTRTIRVTFDQFNAVQPGDPGYTAPANPPYWGSQFEAVPMETKCSLDHHDMLTMKASDKFTCDMSIRFPSWTRSNLSNVAKADNMTVACESGCTINTNFTLTVSNTGGTNLSGDPQSGLARLGVALPDSFYRG
jgi:hypothetical protein